MERELASSAAEQDAGRFRMPIDRAFVLRGHGLVVTGTAVAGRVAEGDTVRLLPGGETVRVRSVERHGTAVPSAGSRQRIALNLAGVERETVTRGHVVCDPALDRATDRFDAFVEVRPGGRRHLIHHGRVRLHIGTADVPGKVVFLDRRPRLEPGSGAWAQLVLAEPVAAFRNDRFILRDQTARWTLAGGVVVHPFADRHRPGDGAPAALAALRDGDDVAAATAFLRLSPDFAVPTETVACALDVELARMAAALAQAQGVVPLPDARTAEAWTTADDWSRFATLAVERVRELHERDPLAPGLELESLRTQLPWDVPLRVFRGCIDRLVADGLLVRDEGIVRAPAHRVRLDREGGALGERLEDLLGDGGLTPPDVRQLEGTLGVARATLLDVLGVLEKQGRVVRIAPDLFYHPDAVAEGTRRITDHCATHGEIGAAAFRDLIGASRKFAIAFLDWTDRTGLTLRVGDLRRLRRPPSRSDAGH
jgi:selenocysteine-specific elongation factor